MNYVASSPCMFFCTLSYALRSIIVRLMATCGILAPGQDDKSIDPRNSGVACYTIGFRFQTEACLSLFSYSRLY